MRAVITVVKTEGLAPADYDKIISESRRERIKKARTPQMAEQQLGAELAFLAAAKKLGISAEYYYLPDGRPQPCAEGYYMSLTHTTGLAACAIASVPVGIDAEGERRMPEHISRKILAPDEQGDLRETWVKKESYVKRTGEGITKGFSNFSVKDIDGFLYDLTLGEYYLSACFTEQTEAEVCTFSQEEIKKNLIDFN